MDSYLKHLYVLCINKIIKPGSNYINISSNYFQEKAHTNVKPRLYHSNSEFKMSSKCIICFKTRNHLKRKIFRLLKRPRHNGQAGATGILNSQCSSQILFYKSTIPLLFRGLQPLPAASGLHLQAPGHNPLPLRQ